MYAHFHHGVGQVSNPQYLSVSNLTDPEVAHHDKMHNNLNKSVFQRKRYYRPLDIMICFLGDHSVEENSKLLIQIKL